MTTTTMKTTMKDAPAPTVEMPQPAKPDTLFMLTARYQAVVSQIEDGYDDGEIPESIETQLDAITGDVCNKLESCFKALRHFEAQAAAAKAEAERVQLLASRRENRVKFFKTYLMNSMLAMGMKKFEGKACVLRVVKNSRPSISVVEGAEIPAEFRREKVVVDFDGTKAYERWKQWKATHDQFSGKSIEPEDFDKLQALRLPAEVRVVEGMHLRTA